MSMFGVSQVLAKLRVPRGGRRSWRRNDDGMAAVEFGIVAMPFFLMIMGIMSTGLQFFTQSSIENGVETASRMILTGQAQTSSPPMNMQTFRNNICSRAGPFINCDSAHLSIIIKSWPNWASLQAQSCISGGGLTPSSGNDTALVSATSGAPGDIVLVTVCYKWDMAKGMPTYMPVKFSDGSALMQATVAFRTEPYQ